MKTILSESKIEQRVDAETGEIVNETISKTFFINTKSETFFLTYVKGLSIIYGIKSAAALRLLYKILELSEFNKTEIQISAPKKKEILKELEISEPCFTKSMKILNDRGLVTGSRGLYTISEDIFWKGDAKTRKALLDARATEIIIKPSNEFEIKENSLNKEK